MKLRLSKCFYHVSLRRGCYIIACTHACLQLVQLNYGRDFQSITFIYSMQILHTLGCLHLFLSALIEMSPLVLVYLISNILQLLISLYTLYDLFVYPRSEILPIVLGAINTLVSIYYWLVAYSFYKLCREDIASLSMNGRYTNTHSVVDQKESDIEIIHVVYRH